MAALYQRARPTTFAQVVGQEHVKEVLASAVQFGRISHAYLFSGPRGVGKTTMARLLAMAVNCSAEPGKAPCGECESCREVQSGSHPDVMELDAASNNSVEDVRDLLERVGLASLRGGTRVWILDEAHMLTKSAANALLKTLEEPPSGLLFVLATTEPERLPPTILSRCQHFRFRRLTDEQIESKLARLASEAGVEVEPQALNLVARTADGGMRDAESLLERLLVLGQPVTLVRTEETLGLPPREQLRALAGALASGDLPALLEEAAQMYRDGFAPRTVAEQLARFLRDALHLNLNGEPTIALSADATLLALHALDDEQERFVRMNDLYALEIALIKTRNALRGNVPVAREPEPAATAQKAVNKAVSKAVQKTAQPPRFEPNARAAKQTGPPATPTSTPAQPQGRPVEADPVSTAGITERSSATSGATSSAPGSGDAPTRRSFSWHNVRAKAGPQLKAFLMPAAASLEGNDVTLTYQDVHSFHHGQLLLRKAELESLLEAEVGPGLRLIIEGPGGQRTSPQRNQQRPAAGPATASVRAAAEPQGPKPTTEPGADPRANARAAKPTTTTPATDPALSSSSFIPDDVALGHEQLPDDFWDSPSVARSEDETPATAARLISKAKVAPTDSRAAAPVHAPPYSAASDEGQEEQHALDDDVTSTRSSLEQAFDQLQSLFPGYVVEVRPLAGDQPPADALPELLDDELDGEGGYDEDDQDRLPFGPPN